MSGWLWAWIGAWIAVGAFIWVREWLWYRRARRVVERMLVGPSATTPPTMTEPFPEEWTTP